MASGLPSYSSSSASPSSSMSLCETMSGSHIFKVANYSLQKGNGVGKFIASEIFSVGAYKWRIVCFMDGDCEENKSYISIYLLVGGEVKDLRIKINLSLLDQSGQPSPKANDPTSQVYPGKGTIWCWSHFIKRDELDQSMYLIDDCFAISCEVQVIMAPHTEKLTGKNSIAVPPTDLPEHLSHLLQSGKEADITFIVGEEFFDAHRIVLAARSPIFNTEQFGCLMEGRKGQIKIPDMEAQIFKALLHFIYTDTLPNMEELIGQATKERTAKIMQHLLIAADRYELKRLKLLCQNKLCECMDVSTLSTTLALAEQHHCAQLKAICLGLMADHEKRLVRKKRARYTDHKMASGLPSCLFSSPSLSSKTISVSPCETMSGSHIFKVANYSLQKDNGVGKFIASESFSAGGHDWIIICFIDGNCEENKSYISVYLVVSEAKDLRVEINLSLLDQSGKPSPEANYTASVVYAGKFATQGWAYFIKKDKLEKSMYLIDDCFTICCKVQVVMAPQTEKLTRKNTIAVPPSDLPEHLSHLLQSAKKADITFIVGEEFFDAHRIVLAARSTVFTTEHFGGCMMEGRKQQIVIQDMEARVFKTLLHFIYTDTLPNMEDLIGQVTKERTAMIMQQLLVAADRYKLKRLKLLCQNKLCECMDVSTLATTLALAEQHHCEQLKAICLRFMADREKRLAVMATDGFKHLMKCCQQLVLKEIFEKM